MSKIHEASQVEAALRAMDSVCQSEAAAIAECVRDAVESVDDGQVTNHVIAMAEEFIGWATSLLNAARLDREIELEESLGHLQEAVHRLLVVSDELKRVDSERKCWVEQAEMLGEAAMETSCGKGGHLRKLVEAASKMLEAMETGNPTGVRIAQMHEALRPFGLPSLPVISNERVK